MNEDLLREFVETCKHEDGPTVRPGSKRRNSLRRHHYKKKNEKNVVKKEEREVFSGSVPVADRLYVLRLTGQAWDEDIDTKIPKYVGAWPANSIHRTITDSLKHAGFFSAEEASSYAKVNKIPGIKYAKIEILDRVSRRLSPHSSSV